MTIAQSLTDMANTNMGGMMPICNSNGSQTLYSRQGVPQEYTQLSTKSAYPTTWHLPYSEDIPVVEPYAMEHGSPHPSNSTSISDSSLYVSGCRWPRMMMTKPVQQGPPTFLDDSSYSQSLQYAQEDIPDMVIPDSHSPLSMSSLQMTLPERPLQQTRFIDMAANQRHLPIPQPNPAQTSRNIVDQMQDQRLRSVQGIGGSVVDTKSSYNKSLAWSLNSDVQDSIGQVENSKDPSNSRNDETDYGSTTATAEGNAMCPTSVVQPPHAFGANDLTSSMTAQLSTCPNNRKSKAPDSQTSRVLQQKSDGNFYNYSMERVGNRRLSETESSNYRTAAAQAYVHLNHDPSHTAAHESEVNHSNFQTQSISICSPSISNVKGGC